MKNGDFVIIKFNQNEKIYRRDADSVMGTVKAFYPGVGFDGDDLIEVEYLNLKEGMKKLPFQRRHLREVTPADLLKAAKHHQEQAIHFRTLARNLQKTQKENSNA